MIDDWTHGDGDGEREREINNDVDGDDYDEYDDYDDYIMMIIIMITTTNELLFWVGRFFFWGGGGGISSLDIQTYPPWNQHSTWKLMVGILVSFSDGLLAGAMLVSGRVVPPLFSG